MPPELTASGLNAFESQRVFLIPEGSLPLFAFIALSNLYVVGLGLVAWQQRYNPLKDSSFSLRKFYVLMGWVPCAFLGLAALFDPRYLLLFLATGLLGVGGELLVSVAWRLFFKVPIWTYSYRSLVSGYTSELNFLPWAVGAFLFHATAAAFHTAFGQPPSAASLEGLLICAAAGAAGMLLWPLAFAKRADRGRFSLGRFAVFCAPIASVAIALVASFGWHYLGLLLAFSLVGFATEYAYGRIMSLFFERGLWQYNHLKIDHGHSSFVTFPLWALGGVYFYLISAWVGV